MAIDELDAEQVRGILRALTGRPAEEIFGLSLQTRAHTLAATLHDLNTRIRQALGEDTPGSGD